MPVKRPRSLVLAAIGFGMVLAACGGSSGSTPSTSARPTAAAATAPAAATSTNPTSPAATTGLGATAAPTSASVACPTAAIVGVALGITLSAPSVVPGGGGTPLPAGATGIACDYRGSASNVLIELIKNIAPASIADFSARFPVPYATASGVGDQARSFLQALGTGKDNEGMVATRGTNLVLVVATATPASLGQIGTLVNQLL